MTFSQFSGAKKAIIYRFNFGVDLINGVPCCPVIIKATGGTVIGVKGNGFEAKRDRYSPQPKKFTDTRSSILKTILYLGPISLF